MTNVIDLLTHKEVRCEVMHERIMDLILGEGSEMPLASVLGILELVKHDLIKMASEDLI